MNRVALGSEWIVSYCNWSECHWRSYRTARTSAWVSPGWQSLFSHIVNVPRWKFRPHRWTCAFSTICDYTLNHWRAVVLLRANEIFKRVNARALVRVKYCLDQEFTRRLHWIINEWRENNSAPWVKTLNSRSQTVTMLVCVVFVVVVAVWPMSKVKVKRPYCELFYSKLTDFFFQNYRILCFFFLSKRNKTNCLGVGGWNGQMASSKFGHRTSSSRAAAAGARQFPIIYHLTNTPDSVLLLNIHHVIRVHFLSLAWSHHHHRGERAASSRGRESARGERDRRDLDAQEPSPCLRRALNIPGLCWRPSGPDEMRAAKHDNDLCVRTHHTHTSRHHHTEKFKWVAHANSFQGITKKGIFTWWKQPKDCNIKKEPY